MSDGSVTIRRSYRELRGLYIGAESIRTAERQPAQKYATVIEGLDDLEVEGTLDKGGFNGGSSSSLRPPRCKPTGAPARPRDVQV